MSTPLRVCLFGAFDAQVQGQPLPRLRTRRGLWLLALLTLHHDREVERAWLAGVLWPDHSQRNALRSLRQTLADLRQALAGEAGRLWSPRPRTLRLQVTEAEADVVAFDAAIARGDTTSLEVAVALYRGPLLEGWTEEWVFEQRQARERAVLEALERLGICALQAGDPAAAVRIWRRAARVDPLSESAHRSLMEALAASGEYAAATQVYRELRLLLHSEMNAAPAPETTARYQAIRDEARRKAAHLPDLAAKVRTDSAVIRTSDVAPVSVAAPSSVSSFTLPAAGMLPQPLTPLVGRETEVDEIASCLKAARLVTLTGAGGVGKTRLAVQVAQQLVRDVADVDARRASALFVDLAPLAEAALVPQTVAAAVGVAEQPGRQMTDTLLVSLQGRRLLLVLDNCEHLVEACARLVAVLLGACPELTILATSRQPLGLPGEVTWRVPSLSLPDAQESGALERLAQYAGVRLFVERVQAVQPGFALTAQNSGAILALCRRLDGIPLALELAAPWVRVLSVQQIAERLASDFRLLTVGTEHSRSGLAIPRHRTLRAAIEWSYTLLTEGEQVLLCRLSVFAGGWDLPAAEHVCGDDASDVLILLAQLIDRSLVLRTEVPETNPEAARGGTRYRMLETVRQFAQEQLSQGGTAARFRQRHWEYFLSLAEHADAERHSPARLELLDWLEVEHDNLRAALHASFSGPEAVLRLSTALWWFWSVRGHWSEGRSWLEDALAASLAAPAARRAPALLRAGMLAFRLADYPAARQWYELSLDAHRAAGLLNGAVTTLYRLGEMAEAQGDYEEARHWLEASLTAAREVEDSKAVAQALAGLGTVAEALGDDAAALPLYHESLALMCQLGARSENIALLVKMGRVGQRTGDAIAWPLQEEALAISREQGDRGGVVLALNGLGLSRLAEGDPAAAKELFLEALSIGRELCDERSVASSLYHCGLAARGCGELAAAGKMLREALAKQWALGDRRGAGASLRELGLLAQALGDERRAVTLWAAGSELPGINVHPRLLREQVELPKSTAEIRQRVGEEVYLTGWEAGSTLGWDAAVHYALWEPPAGEVSAGGHPDFDPLP